MCIDGIPTSLLHVAGIYPISEIRLWNSHSHDATGLWFFHHAQLCCYSEVPLSEADSIVEVSFVMVRYSVNPGLLCLPPPAIRQVGFAE